MLHVPESGILDLSILPTIFIEVYCDALFYCRFYKQLGASEAMYY